MCQAQEGKRRQCWQSESHVTTPVGVFQRGMDTGRIAVCGQSSAQGEAPRRSEEHTSELQSPCNLVCRLLLEKKKHTHTTSIRSCTVNISSSLQPRSWSACQWRR